MFLSSKTQEKGFPLTIFIEKTGMIQIQRCVTLALACRDVRADLRQSASDPRKLSAFCISTYAFGETVTEWSSKQTYLNRNISVQTEGGLTKLGQQSESDWLNTLST